VNEKEGKRVNLEKRLTKLEGRSIPEPCPACDPGPGTSTIVYGVDDPDPRTPPGGQETPDLQECVACGRRYRVYGGER